MRQPSKVLVIDDFYDNPDRVRDISLSATYSLKNSNYFTRSSGYLSDGMLSMFEEFLGIKIDYDSTFKVLRKTGPKRTTTGLNFNGTFYKYSPEADKAKHIHHDCYDWVGLVMLSPNCPSKYGTSFWEHKETQKSFTSNKYIECTPFDPIVGSNKEEWREVDFVEYKYNRLILYSGRLFHSANFDPDIERINQLFCFNEASIHNTKGYA